MYLVDDVPEMRELVKYAMEDDPAFEVVGEAGDGRSGARRNRRDAPGGGVCSTSRCRT